MDIESILSTYITITLIMQLEYLYYKIIFHVNLDDLRWCHTKNNSLISRHINIRQFRCERLYRFRTGLYKESG